jgi:hypothetical protein
LGGAIETGFERGRGVSYCRKGERKAEPIAADGALIRARLGRGKGKRSGVISMSGLGDFWQETRYVVSLFDLVLTLYAIPLNDPAFDPLRKALQQQWEERLAGIPAETTPPQPDKPAGKRFTVALSFPGEYREFVKQVAEALAEELGRERVFYDAYYTAELARPNFDTYLQAIYHDQADLIVVFLCAEYEKKEWCGLEWRAVRDLLKTKQDEAIMRVRFDKTHIPGFFSIDGYLDAQKLEPAEVAGLIIARLKNSVL